MLISLVVIFHDNFQVEHFHLRLCWFVCVCVLLTKTFATIKIPEFVEDQVWMELTWLNYNNKKCWLHQLTFFGLLLTGRISFCERKYAEANENIKSVQTIFYYVMHWIHSFCAFFNIFHKSHELRKDLKRRFNRFVKHSSPSRGGVGTNKNRICRFKNGAQNWAERVKRMRRKRRNDVSWEFFFPNRFWKRHHTGKHQHSAFNGANNCSQRIQTQQNPIIYVYTFFLLGYKLLHIELFNSSN